MNNDRDTKRTPAFEHPQQSFAACKPRRKACPAQAAGMHPVLPHPFVIDDVQAAKPPRASWMATPNSEHRLGPSHPSAACLLAIVLASFTLGMASSLGADWPQFLGPNRNGTAPDTQLEAWPADGPRQVWSVQVGQGHSSPVVAGGRTYLFHRPGDQEVLEAYDAATGKSVWKNAAPATYSDDFGFDEGPRATPVVDDGRVFALGADGRMLAVRAADGSRLWELDLKKTLGAEKGFFGFASSPLVRNNTVIVNAGGTTGAGIIGLDAETGKILWKTTAHEAGYSSPVPAPGSKPGIVCSFTREGVVILDPTTGRSLGEFPWRARMHASVNAAAPVATDGEVFVTSSYGVGAALLKWNDKGLTKVWSGDDSLSSHFSTPVLKDGFLYGFHGRQEQGASLRCVDWKTGKVRWEKARTGTGGIVIAGSRLLILLESGELVLAEANPAQYRELARTQLLGRGVRALPALAGGRLYARDGKRLACWAW